MKIHFVLTLFVALTSAETFFFSSPPVAPEISHKHHKKESKHNTKKACPIKEFGMGFVDSL